MKRFAASGIAALAMIALAGSNSLAAKPLTSIGISVGDLANPYFVAISQGAEETAKKLGGPNVKITTVSSKYDQHAGRSDRELHRQQDRHHLGERGRPQRDRPRAKKGARCGDHRRRR
jgi:hypothetical protein